MSSHLDGLYPEWDEFYLLVCDICGIIIRPQALEKHLSTKHRINLPTTNSTNNHDTNHVSSQPPLPNNQKTSNCNNNCNNANNHDTNHITSKQTTTHPNSRKTSDNNLGSNNCSSNGNSNNTGAGCKQTTNSKASPVNTILSFKNQQQLRPSQARKWQVRKWRNTFHVLRDAFF